MVQCSIIVIIILHYFHSKLCIIIVKLEVSQYLIASLSYLPTHPLHCSAQLPFCSPKTLYICQVQPLRSASLLKKPLYSDHILL